MKQKILLTLALLITAVGGAWAQKRGGINADASVAKARIMAKTPRRALAIPGNATILYQQNFDGTNDINELGWTFVDNDGDGGNWMMSINGKYDIYEDSPSKTSTSVPNSLYSQSYTDDWEEAINADNWAITPAIEIYESSILSFQLAYGNYTYPDKVGVYVGETANVNEMTEVLALTSFSRTDHLQFNEETVDLSAFAGKTCYIAFRHKDYDNYVVFIDDVTVYTTDPRFYSFTMPASDVTVNYTLVRDMQDEANPVTFSGLPTNDEPIIVKKGDDGKYQPAEELNIQLIDPLAAAEAQNIIAADGITIKVLVGAENGQGAIDYDQENPITLEAFLADIKPGYYWIKAEPTDENSPYDGTVYSSEFTAVEQYDLTVKPANDFSKNGLDAVTVGSESVTIDANTGEATKTGVAPDTEVKIKAKRGYVIEKVEVKKGGLLSIEIGGAATAIIYYVEGETWEQALQNHPTENSAWKIEHGYIIGNGYLLSAGGNLVSPDSIIDPNAGYSFQLT